MTLSEDQMRAFRIFESGQNLFLTGPGGTGKSHLIRYMTQSSRKPQVCAMTGTAALLLECKASTLHSWAGIGTGEGDLLLKVTSSSKARKKWKQVKSLIVDEVSMMSAAMFEQLDAVAKSVRKSREPFGGIQIVFCGDFCQLPPVSSDATAYCFQSALWDATFPEQFVLTTLHRQKDPAFCKILQQLRMGKITRSSYDVLMSRVLSETLTMEGPATQLVPTRDRADRINKAEYMKLTGEEVTYTAELDRHFEMTTAKRKIRACIPSSYVELESENLRTKRITPMVTLKVGTHVMCTQNVDETLCNGSQGVVVRFEQGLPVVQWWNGTRLVRPFTIESEKVPGVAVIHMPLMYAWAVTIHKAQGATLHSALIDVGTGIFEAGQTYTALSRLSSLDFLYLTSFDPNKIKTNPAVIAFYEKLAERAATSATDNLIETRGI